MAVAVYTTDLTTLNTGEATTNWAEPTVDTAGGLPVAETDYFIQGTGCISKTFNAVGTGGLLYNATSGQTITTPACVFIWLYMGAPNALDTYANGGYQVCVGSGLGAYKKWYVLGSNTYSYGGWVCVAVDPSLTADATAGAPTATLQYFGSVAKTINAIAKGNPFANDAVRFGRTLQVVSGDATAYGTFAGAAAENDTVTNRWGLCQAVAGGVLQKGLFLMGVAATAVDFRDSNTSVLIENSVKVASSFNAFEVRHASSRVDWTSISFLALGTVSKGNFIITDNADINWTTCTFTNVGTFAFLAASTLDRCTFRNTGLITQAGAAFTGCTISGTSDTVKAMIASNPATISDCVFVAGATPRHAIEITTAGTYTFDGNTFSGFGDAMVSFHTTNDVDGSADTVAETAHGYSNGDEVFYRKQGGSAAIGLTDATVYYVRAVSANLLAFYTSSANAISDTSRINLTASGSDTHYVYSTSASIYNNSAGAVTLNITGGGDANPSVRNGASATTTIVASANLTFTGLIANTEVRAYTGTDPATSVEIGSVENSGTSFNFSHSSGGTAGYVILHKEDYEAIYLPITYSSADQSIPIQQRLDRQYSNPV